MFYRVQFDTFKTEAAQKEASTRSGISVGVMKAAWDAAGEVIKAWVTEGHSIPLPGLGTMRFGVRSKAVEDLEDVKTNLITTRRIVFTPSVDVKEELMNTSIQITCLDEDGTVLKRSCEDIFRLAIITSTLGVKFDFLCHTFVCSEKGCIFAFE